MKKCMDTCTDGIKSVTGPIKSRQLRKNSERSNSHCAVYHHQLASKGIPSDFSSVSDDVIKNFNFIVSRPLRTRIFFVIYWDMGSLHRDLLLNTSVRWLSRVKALMRVF